MTDNYQRIITANLEALYQNAPVDLETRLPAVRDNQAFEFNAFGRRCRLQPDGIFLDEEYQSRVLGILISLYALHVQAKDCQLTPFKSYKDFPGSMPYVGAFTSHTEQILVGHVERIRSAADPIINRFQGSTGPTEVGGDFSLLLYPLPKIALCYIFYLADEDFPASVTCLFSNNATEFMPLDGLADVGEYTSRAILEILDPP